MIKKFLTCILFSAFSFFNSVHAESLSQEHVASIVNKTIKPLLKEYDIPGMAVAIIYDGQPYFFNYGVANIKAQKAVTENTLFELGSISKTFTGTAAAYAVQTGILNLNDPVKKYAPELTGKQWKDIKMLHLATYTAGGLPLQLPNSVTDQKSLTYYFQQWEPQWAPGVVRVYSNPSIGLFGALAVKKSPLSFEDYVQKHLLDPLELKETFITVPRSHYRNYAWGYRNGEPIRVADAMLSQETYGMKSSTHDMAKYMQAQLYPDSVASDNAKLSKAIAATQNGYFQAGEMFQGLGWEMYSWPIDSKSLISSNTDVATKPTKVEQLTPPRSEIPLTWIHKTGGTNGFGAYMAFIPGKRIGIVMLANKNYPNPARVQAGYDILQELAH